LGNTRLDGAHLRRSIDQLLVERAAILSDRRDVGFQLLLQLGGATLLDARRFELLLALLDRIRRDRGLGSDLGCSRQRDARREQRKRKSGGDRRALTALGGSALENPVPR